MPDILLQPVLSDFSSFKKLSFENNFGFEIISLCHPLSLIDPKKVSEQLIFFRKELKDFKKTLSFHGPFIDIVLHSIDPEIAAVSKSRINSALKMANDIGCQYIVFHTGFNPLINHEFYFNSVARIQGEFWRTKADEYPEITIVLENMWEESPDFFLMILDIADRKNLGVCLDVGHQNVFSKVPLSDWMKDLGEHIKYFHLNDNHGEFDEENHLGKGTIDWKMFGKLVKLREQSSPMVLEVGDLDSIVKSMDFISQNKIFS